MHGVRPQRGVCADAPVQQTLPGGRRGQGGLDPQNMYLHVIIFIKNIQRRKGAEVGTWGFLDLQELHMHVDLSDG